MISSDWQLEQTGVDRIARRLTICAGSGFALNGLRSKASLIFLSPLTIRSSDFLLHNLSAGITSVSLPGPLVAVDCGVRSHHCGALTTERSPSLWHAPFRLTMTALRVNGQKWRFDSAYIFPRFISAIRNPAGREPAGVGKVD